ncbi:hypothetical protein [Novosphingobium sp. JCM 18896]|uniref:hypothetical protein n=1 Tax=Novosphingobium sp. JCM 18896 TaxID=2989731 RepID=UPI0022221E24|nr:hypothetical protein [Novosphingobium sp. JCM 18896]MCW1429523.1 hypothetical protein [Novosphingobium sp. JCM 18896]
MSASWTGGLEPDIDYMLAERPDDPEMRESASIWLYEDNGAFAFPRIGIEAKGDSWDSHGFQFNFVDRAGRAIVDGGAGTTHSPIGSDGKASILGTGGLVFECLEPFHKWRVRYDGQGADTTPEALIAQSVDRDRRAPLRLDVELTMALPGWTQDLRPERLVGMTEAERIDAGLMGYGWRVEQAFRAEGELTLDGQTRVFRGSGNRIHRQSVRPLGAFRGHCWQAALFPDGRAFALCVYPPREDGTTHNGAYVYVDGQMYPAVARGVPFLTRLTPRGEDVSFELDYALGTARIEGVSDFNVFHLGVPEMPGFALHQGGARYTWEGQSAHGMIERSNWADQLVG